jgi:DNA-binding XRE family transcriptional regulator
MTAHTIGGWRGRIRDGAGGRAWLTWVQVLPALCRVVVRRDEDLWGCQAMAEQVALGFGDLLRQLRAEAGLTQEELAEAAGLSPRSVSDLERGIHPTARKDTAELLAGPLGLAEPARPLFVAAARGRAPAEQVLATLKP